MAVCVCEFARIHSSKLNQKNTKLNSHLVRSLKDKDVFCREKGHTLLNGTFYSLNSKYVLSNTKLKILT